MLVAELEAARGEFNAALAEVEPDLLLAPGLVGEWSARELIAHIGYWTGHAAEALHSAEQGRLADFGEDELDVDERNEVVARVAAETDLATVRHWLESFLFRYFELSQFKRSAIPNGPKVSSGGALSPRHQRVKRVHFAP